VLPEGSALDGRFSEIRRTDNEGFTPAEPLQYWIDLITSGISPRSVKLLGIDGGSVAGIEYRIALALRASVAVVAGSGQEAARLVQDDEWRTSETLIQLPKDPLSAQVFIGSTEQTLPTAVREHIAREIHENYRKLREKEQSEDPALAKWDKLVEHFKNSNRAQADYIAQKLSAAGYGVRKARGTPVVRQFSPEEVEIMAELEHGRWNVERLLGGWKWGPIKDEANKTSPLIIPWSELPEEWKEYDRDTARQIPDYLEKVGMEVVRMPASKRKSSHRKPTLS